MTSHKHQIFICFFVFSTKCTHGLSLINLKKWRKEKGGFIEVGKLLEDSFRSKHMKIRSSRSKFEHCSNVCVGKRGFCFFLANTVNT